MPTAPTIWLAFLVMVLLNNVIPFTLVVFGGALYFRFVGRLRLELAFCLSTIEVLGSAQETQRVRAAMRALLGEAEMARLLAEGAALDDDRATPLAQSP